MLYSVKGKGIEAPSEPKVAASRDEDLESEDEEEDEDEEDEDMEGEGEEEAEEEAEEGECLNTNYILKAKKMTCTWTPTTSSPLEPEASSWTTPRKRKRMQRSWKRMMKRTTNMLQQMNSSVSLFFFKKINCCIL